MENGEGSNIPDLGPRERLLQKAKEAATSPGVYLMRDEKNGILYVGKAKNLRNRVTTYFQPARHDSLRTELMVSHARDFEVILTETETEALILECTLIKKYKPHFNVRLKDDKAYPYIRIQTSDAFPRLEWTRKVRRDGAAYFGPFTSAWSAKQTMRLLIETFQLRDCSDNTFRHRSRPCILHQMGKCTAPCVGLISHEDYRERVQEATAILQGKSEKIIEQLERGMRQASESMEYELAAEYRDQVQNLKLVTETQSVLDASTDRDRDVLGLARDQALAHGTILQIRAGRLVSVRHYRIQNVEPEITDAQLMFDFLSQHYLSQEALAAEQEETPEELKDPTAVRKPREVLVPELPADHELLEKAAGLEVMLEADRKLARKQETEHQLLSVARTNAQHALEQAKRHQGGHGLQALEEVFHKLHLSKIPHRIECYDISNTQGSDPVASRVVFMGGAPEKELYRRYKIKTVVGSNDFAMMKEVLGRRFARLDEELPDLVVVDGGRGQLSQAVAIMDELNIQGVEVVGLAKARTERNFKSAEVEGSSERIFIPGRVNPIPLAPHTQAYKLLTHVRDEAHRFAITFHRSLRAKRSLKSEG